jgi:hypothetical protein
MRHTNPQVHRLTPTALTPALVLATLLCWAGPSLAGRPLSVDDANVNEVGAGHVEAWYARQSGDTNVWTVAPAYGIAKGVEIGAAVARDATNDASTNTLQAKFQLTSSLKDGCNLGASVGASQTNNGLGNTVFVNGLVTCNTGYGSVHVNLGSNRPPQGPSLGTWGVALERELGPFTAHGEVFGQEKDSPTVQVGLRTEVVKNITLDGTAGRANGESVLSLGLKFQF